jgi:hypothetical protein
MQSAPHTCRVGGSPGGASTQGDVREANDRIQAKARLLAAETYDVFDRAGRRVWLPCGE